MIAAFVLLVAAAVVTAYSPSAGHPLTLLACALALASWWCTTRGPLRLWRRWYTARQRRAERVRLDALHDALWPAALAGDPDAAAALLGVMERRLRMEGVEVNQR